MKRSLAAVVVVACAGGACLGQTWTFPINGLQEVPANAGTGTGTGMVTYLAGTNELQWTLNWSGLTGAPFAMHFHTGAAGANGPHAVTIGAFTAASTGSAEGGAIGMTPAFVDALLSGNVYVNIHTLAFAGGEIRGQVVPAPSAAGFAVIGAGVLASRRRR